MLTLVNLGVALELRMKGDEDWHFARKDGFVVASALNAKMLYILSTKYGQNVSTIISGKRIKDAEQLWQRWSGFEPDRAIKTKVTSRKLHKIGVAVAICYRSDKWTGKAADYIHHFEATPSIYADDSDRPTVFEIRGRLKVKAEGITG